MEKVPLFDGQQLESIARLLADTDEGLTGSQIGHLLQECRMADPTPSMTKWKRLYNALVDAQNQHHVGNHVVMFINRVMKPVRYTTDPQGFAKRRDQCLGLRAMGQNWLRERSAFRKMAALRGLPSMTLRPTPTAASKEVSRTS